MTLAVDIAHRQGEFSLKARFACEAGITALFGRSGAGKTTLVNLIAGLLRPERGRIVLDGRVLVDRAAGIFVPPHKRRIGYVFQEARLFPHLNVRQNLLYGRWFNDGRDAAGFAHVAGMLGLNDLLARRPGNLSGGEKQRVAIGRALLARPHALLMDEPLASLDVARKEEILPYLERLRDETKLPIVYVSHAIPEVMRLADTVVLLSDGSVQAVGSVAELTARLDLFPLIGRYEAGAVLEAAVESHDAAYGLTLLRLKAGILRVPLLDLAPGSIVRPRIRARDVTLALGPPQDTSALNILPGIVAEIGAAAGAMVDIKLDCGGDLLLARITRLSLERLGLRPGARVHAMIKTVALDRRSLGRLEGR